MASKIIKRGRDWRARLIKQVVGDPGILTSRAGEAETRVLDLLAEIALAKIELLKNRQLPEGWHVGKMRGGELVPLIESGHLYLACYGIWSVNSGGFAESENGSENDIIEIDGVKTEAGDK